MRAKDLNDHQRAILRVRLAADRKGWVCVRLDMPGGSVIDRSPHGDEVQAEQYLNNYRRYGAWQRS